jgi:hypothetical protein
MAEEEDGDGVDAVPTISAVNGPDRARAQV